MKPAPDGDGWAALRAAYAEPLSAAEATSAGTPFVGLLGGGVPLELVHAAGCAPIAVRPTTAARVLAGRYLAPAAPVEIAGRLERLLSGELRFLALAVMTSRYEIDALLYHSAKEILRRGEGDALPPLHLHVLLGDQLQAARDYNADRARRLVDRMAAVSGVKASPERIGAAVEALNQVRAELERLEALRLEGRLSGVEAMEALGAGRILPPERYARHLSQALDAAAAAEPDKDAPRLLLMSSGELFHPELHAALEGAGGKVVLEDGDWGARSFGPKIALEAGQDPLTTVVEHYRTHTPGLAVYPHSARHAWFYAQAQRPEVDAVVFHVPLNEAPLGWDYPRLARFVAGLGKPALLLRDDPLAEAGRAQISALTRAFLADARLERCA